VLKKTITYLDFNGNEITEDFYFNLTKAEIAEMELGTKGGFTNYLKTIVQAEDGAAIIAAFKNIIAKSYGQRTEDGKGFVKSKSFSDWFMSTEAYSTLFMQIVSDGDFATTFMKGIMPAGFADKIDEAMKEEGSNSEPPWIRDNRDPSKAEIVSMTREQLLEVMRRGSVKEV